jgi:hypothetical protein
MRVGKVSQLRKVDRQGRNGSGKDATLAETLAERSMLSGTPGQFRQSVPTQGRRASASARGLARSTPTRTTTVRATNRAYLRVGGAERGSLDAGWSWRLAGQHR